MDEWMDGGRQALNFTLEALLLIGKDHWGPL